MLNKGTLIIENHNIPKEAIMNKHLLLGLSLTISIAFSVNSMDVRQGFYVPTKFKLETVLDKVSIGNICQTLSLTAGVSLLYKAANNWAQSETNFPETIQSFPSEADRAIITQARKKAALRYLISGCAFVTAGLIHRYGPKMLALFTKNAH